MVWWAVACMCAFFIKGLCGFANTLVFTTILSFGNNNKNISPIELLLGYPTNFILAWRERKSVDPKICVPLSIMVLAGSIPGIIFLKNMDADAVKVVFGFVIILISIEMFLRDYKIIKFKNSKLVLSIIGVLSGVLCGIYGVGALLGAYISRVTEDSSAFKGNICMVFFVENTFRIVLYTIYGIINLETLQTALLFAPLMLAGLFLGIVSGKLLNEKIVKKAVIFMLAVSGVALICNNL